MRRFRREGDVITTTMDADEVELLDSLAGQLVSMLSDDDEGDDGGDDDPFSFWARDLADDPDEPEVPDDPAVARLFPNAYPHDPQAASEFRRFTQVDLAQAKIDSAVVVQRGLAATENGRLPVRITDTEVTAWLKFFTNVRLVFAARLGIDDVESAERIAALPQNDPRSFMVSVYEWLGFAQETLVGAL